MTQEVLKCRASSNRPQDRRNSAFQTSTAGRRRPIFIGGWICERALRLVCCYFFAYETNLNKANICDHQPIIIPEERRTQVRPKGKKLSSFFFFVFSFFSLFSFVF